MKVYEAWHVSERGEEAGRRDKESPDTKESTGGTGQTGHYVSSRGPGVFAVPTTTGITTSKCSRSSLKK